ncbi:MAG: aminomethyltransferase family protein, partial [Phycisphaerales bacterium]|nr:aminomethyltransferase family protein [Phycisphaerales bacterium]
SFLLNRKGRIDADLVLVETGNRILVDLDRAVAASTAAALDAFLFTEDVRIADRSDAFHQVQVHGPRAHEVLAAALGESEPIALDPHCAGAVTLAGVDVVVLRRDLTGEPGYAIIMPRDGAGAVWAALLETDAVLAEGRRRIRPVGWYAFNVARIEAGTPLFNIDFGATNLPHETGLIDARVHFAKGCYVGQEVVARMHNLGRPKQILVGLRMRADRLPVADGQVFAPGDDGAIGTPVGVVTSSTLSPMLGAAPIAFAMIRTVVAAAGRPVLVNAEGEQVEADLGPLTFWTPGAPGAST